MAQRRIIYRVCDRCRRSETKAQHSVRFNDGATEEFRLDLCADHYGDYMRSMGRWIQYAEARPLAAKITPRDMEIEEERDKPAAPAPRMHLAEQLGWTMGGHAEEQLEARGEPFSISRQDVNQALINGATYPAEAGRERRVWRHVSLVVDPRTKTVVTVMPTEWGDQDRRLIG